MRVTRLFLGAVGIVLVAVGVFHLMGSAFSNLLAIIVFLAGGVAAHDLVVAPLVVLVGALLVPRLSVRWRAPVVVGLVVVLSVTLVGVPVLGRFGAKPDDPWLLPRSYGVLWLAFAALVAVLVAVAALVRRRRGD